MAGSKRQVADLFLHNAHVVTLDEDRPRASQVAIRDGLVLATGDGDDLEMLRAPDTRIVDCEGQTVLPGLIDAHIHLFSYAASLMAVDCSPRAVSSITGIQEALRRRASQTPPGDWVRGWGYEEFYLEEGRQPNRWDLDAVTPAHPVKLFHRSGHASVLNSLGLERLGITQETPEPPGSLIDRALDTGELTGGFLEMEEELERRGAPTLAEADLAQGLRQARMRLLSAGITAIHEATPNRAIAQWEMLAGLKRSGAFPQRVRKMVAVEDLDELRRRGLFFGAGDPGLRVGAVKVMMNETGETALPRQEELRDRLLRIHEAGYQAAFHAVEEAAIAAVIDAAAYLQHHAAGGAASVRSRRHRVEHCGLCPPELRQKLASLGLVVVTQPGFIQENGDRYLAQVPGSKHPWLYPIASLREAGVTVAFGSDCPVAPPEPMTALHSATTRSTCHGAMVTPMEAVSVQDAVRMHITEAAYVGWDEDRMGTVTRGKVADLVFLSGDPTASEPERLDEIAVERVMIGGELVWERS